MKGDASRVRAYLSGLSPRRTFTPAQVAQALGEKNAVTTNYVFKDFMRRGEIVRVSPGHYRRAGKFKLREGRAVLKLQILRAMHLKDFFSAREIAVLSDATRGYVSKVIRELARAGEVQRIGGRKDLFGNSEGVYRLVDRDGFFLNHLASRGGRGKSKNRVKKGVME